MALTYLTVQDLIWMNLQVTGKVNDFQFMPLEEATYYQYSLGAADPLESAIRFASGFVKNAPFTAGNEATAFLGLTTFLAVNGSHLTIEDAAAANWFEKLVSSPSKEALAGVLQASESSHGADVHESAAEIMERYPETIRHLSTSGSQAPVSA